MVQNTTRKGWAVAAVVSLFAALLGASPAQAAVGDGLALKVTPANTTSVAYTTLVGQTFTVTPTMDNPSDYQFLKYEITNVSGFTMSYDVTSAGTSAASESGVVSTSAFVVDAHASSTAASKLAIALEDATTVSGPVTVSVRVFVESVIDGKYTAGEANSQQIITFVPFASAGASVALDAVGEGTDALKATVAFTGINSDQIVKPTVEFFQNASTVATLTATSSLVATTSATSTATATDTFSAIAYVGGEKIATSATVTATARTIKFVTASAVAAANITAGTTTASARANSAFTVQVKTTTSSSGAVAVAGIAGTYKVETSATLSSVVTLAVAGTTYTTKASLPTKGTFTTDANGVAKLDLVPTGFSTSDVITVSFTAQNITSTIRISQDVAKYTITNADGDYAYAAKGGSVVLKYNVKDQWKVLSSAKQRLVLTDNGADFTFANAYPELVSGVASATLAAKYATSSGTVTVSATLQKWDTDSQNWVNATAELDDDVKIVFSDAALAFVSKPASDSASVSAPATISGSVNLEGGSVVISGTGLVFTNADGDTSSNAVTVRTGENGLFTVSATSKVAGKYAVTVTAGTYSQAIVITIDPVTADDGKNLVIATADGLTTAAPGTTVRLSFKLTDANGNAVEVKDADTASLKVEVSGPGFWGTLPTTTDEDGMAYLNVLLASADKGDLKIMATYTPTAGSTKAVTASLTVTVGVVAVVSSAKVNVGTFNGFIAVYAKGYNGSTLSWKIAGKWFKTTVAKDFAVYQRKTAAIGLDVNVDIYVDGVKELSKTVTTK